MKADNRLSLLKGFGHVENTDPRKGWGNVVFASSGTADGTRTGGVEEEDELLGAAKKGLVPWSSLGPRVPSSVSVVAG